MAEQSLPTWEDVGFPCLVLPIEALVCMAGLLALLRWCYVAWGLRTHRLVLNHIGCCEHPYPRIPFFLTAVNFGQVVASLWTMGVFVFNTYQRTVGPVSRWVEVTLGIFLAFHFLVRGFRQEFMLSALLHPEQLVDVATVPAMLLLSVAGDSFVQVHWVSLNFLRSLSALLAYQQLENLGAVRIGSGELLHEIASMVLRFLALVVCFASSILMLEILGDPSWREPSTISTAMGEITFFTMTYWIVETITTVGYGDFTPKTVLSRSVTILCMVTGFAFLGFEMERIISIISRTKKGAGSYMKTSRSHCVLVGGGVQQADELLLTAFFEELYHRSYRSHWPDLVVMAPEVQCMEKVRQMIELQIEWQVRQKIHYLVGSPLNLMDLKRACCESASVVFIVSDTSGKAEPAEEDKENLLRALSVRNTFPNTPIRLMLLLQESKEKATSVGIAAHMSFAVNEMKNSLFWQACRCSGWNTLLCNLMVTTETDEIDERVLAEAPWLREYVLGMGFEVYGFVPAKEFHGASLQTMVCEAYRQTGICIFAAQLDGVIVTAPLRHLRSITKDTVLFALAQDQADLLKVAQPESKVDWRQVFMENRFKKHDEVPHFIASNRRSRLEEDDVQEGSPGNGCVYLPPPYPDLPEMGPTELMEMERERSRKQGGGRHSPRGGREYSPRGREFPPRGRAANQRSVQPKGQPSLVGTALRHLWQHAKEVKLPSPPRRKPAARSNGEAQPLISPRGGGGAQSNGAGTPSPRGDAWNNDSGEDFSPRTDTSTRSDEGHATAKKPALLKGRSNSSWNAYVAAANLSGAVPQHEVREFERRAEVIRANASHCPFVLLLDVSQSWQTITPFLVQSRAPYNPFEVAVVILSSVPPPRAVAETLRLGEDKGLGLVLGSVSWAPDLIKAGAQESSSIVALGQPLTGDAGFGGELIAMLDADVVMLHRMLDSIGVSDKAMILEFKRTQNMRLLPIPTQYGSHKTSTSIRSSSSKAPRQTVAPVQYLAPRDSSRDLFVADTSTGAMSPAGSWWRCMRRCPIRGGMFGGTSSPGHEAASDNEAGKSTHESDDAKGFHLDPRFAAGEIFTPHFLGALLAHAYYTPGVVEVMQELVIVGEDAMDGAALPWQVYLRPEDEGKTYLDIFVELVEDDLNPVMPLGLLRSQKPAEASTQKFKPYVWTNPSPDAVLRSGDLLYVLGDREFGQLMLDAGRLPLSAPSVMTGRSSSMGRLSSMSATFSNSISSGKTSPRLPSPPPAGSPRSPAMMPSPRSPRGTQRSHKSPRH